MASQALRKGEHAGQFLVGSSVPRFVARPTETELLLPGILLLLQSLLLLLACSLLTRVHPLPLLSLLFLLLARLVLTQLSQLRNFEPPPLLLPQVQYLRHVALKKRGLGQTVVVIRVHLGRQPHLGRRVQAGAAGHRTLGRDH